jgi:hypothetical protein
MDQQNKRRAEKRVERDRGVMSKRGVKERHEELREV